MLNTRFIGTELICMEYWNKQQLEKTLLDNDFSQKRNRLSKDLTFRTPYVTKKYI